MTNDEFVGVRAGMVVGDVVFSPPRTRRLRTLTAPGAL